jgi:hypothetical protein
MIHLKMGARLLAHVAVVLLLGLLPTVPAQAYGNLAVYQTAFSFNCNNPAVCGSQNLGGFWGWAEFDSDNTADAELVGCSHLQGGGPAAGAQHFEAEATGWFIALAADGSGRLDFWVTGETDTFTGRHGGPPVSVTTPGPTDTGIPATPGHYNVTSLFGFSAPPGFAIQIQVVKIPNR